MSWRGVYVSKPARLSLAQRQLLITPKEGDSHSFALEDIGYIVLDTQHTTFSGALLSACAVSGCLVIACDEKHTPCGVLLPYSQHYRQAETTAAQLALPKPRRKRLWQEIIRHKIRNQASCLQVLGRATHMARKVAACEQKVRSGDPDNVEAHAARLYWSAYMTRFSRDADGADRLNSMLNYGYALVRAAMARELSALGFITCLGVHHKNMQNAFNLADDMLEPWRPFVDRLAMTLFRNQPGEDILSPLDKRKLCGIFAEPVLFEEGEQELLSGLRRQTGMFKAWALGRQAGIAFPDFVPHKR